MQTITRRVKVAVQLVAQPLDTRSRRISTIKDHRQLASATMNHLFSSMPMGVQQHQQSSTLFILSEPISKTKELTISQLGPSGTQSSPLYAVKVSSSEVEISRLSTPPESSPQHFKQPRMHGQYTPQQQQMQYFTAPPYPGPGISSPEVYIPVPQELPSSRPPAKNASFLSSLSSRAEYYLNKSSTLSMLQAQIGGSQVLPYDKNTTYSRTTPIATIRYHSLSSKIDVLLHSTQRTLTIAKPDFLSSGHQFDMGLSPSISQPSQNHHPRQLTAMRWKKEEDMLSGSSTGLRLDTVDTRQTIARFHKKLKLRNGRSSAIEVFLPLGQLRGSETLDTIIVTAIAMAKYRADADKEEKDAAGEVVSAILGG